MPNRRSLRLSQALELSVANPRERGASVPIRPARPTRRVGLIVAAMLPALLWVGARAGGASEIQYTFRGKVGWLIQNDPGNDRPSDRYPSSANLDGSDVRVGDPFEATLTVEDVAPTRVEVHPAPESGTYAEYLVPEEQASFSALINGEEIGDWNATDDLRLSVAETLDGDSFTGTQQFDPLDPSMSQVEVRIGSFGSEDLFSGVGLPESFDFSAIDDGSTPRPTVILDSMLENLTSLLVVGSIESIDVSVDGAPAVPSVPATPSTTIPEPGMMTLFGGMTLAALAWRRLRNGAKATAPRNRDNPLPTS